MFHQVEEHTGDRFREFLNRMVFGGLDALTHAAVLWINLPGVWGVGLVAIYAAPFAGIGWGLCMVYLTLVNAVIHVAAAIGLRRYNPGLWTALALFFPVGEATLWVISREPGVTWDQQLVGLGVGIGIHVAIIVHTGMRARQLRAVA